MAGAFILQLRDTMSLRTADVGSVCVRARSFWLEECHVWIGDWKRGAAGSGAAWGRLGGMLDRSPSSRRRDGSARWRWRKKARAAVLLRIWRQIGCPQNLCRPTAPNRALLPPPLKVHMHATGSSPPKSHRQRNSPAATKVKMKKSSLDRPFDNPATEIATPPPETRCAQLIRFHIP